MAPPASASRVLRLHVGHHARKFLELNNIPLHGHTKFAYPVQWLMGTWVCLPFGHYEQCEHSLCCAYLRVEVLGHMIELFNS